MKRRRPYSICIPIESMSFFNRAVSLAMNAASSAGVHGAIPAPCARNIASNSGARRTNRA